MPPDETVDHEARSNAKLALEKIQGHERRCDERMERVEKMFTRIKEGQDKLWESVDQIRGDAKQEGFISRDLTIKILRWTVGIIAAALVASIGWHIRSAHAHSPAPDWIMDGGYETAETASRNDFDSAGPLGKDCCGPNDCRTIAVADYDLHPDGSASVRFRDREFTLSKGSVFRSEDTRAWFCASGRDGADAEKIVERCLFWAPSVTRRHPP